VVVRPREFQTDRKYPVLNHVYGGPTFQTVRRSARRYLLDPWFADHGFIVISIDVRYPEMDLERVGIYGWSFGGYFSAMAAMREGELFKAAVASRLQTRILDFLAEHLAAGVARDGG